MVKSFRTLLGDLLLPGQTAADMPVPEEFFCDSRKVTPGSLFVAVNGASCDGHCYIAEAMRRGAGAVIGEKDGFPLTLKVRDSVAAFAAMVKNKYDNADEKIKLFGVTGTNGKTSTVFILRHLLSEMGELCGLVSTVETFDGRKNCPASATTPDIETLYQLFDGMVKNSAGFAAMEFSSHSLAQRRSGTVKAAGAIFTNLTRDHLDYHRTFDDYFAAKRRLFCEHLAPDGVAVINIDDPCGRELYDSLICRKAGFSVSGGGDWRISEIATGFSGSSFVLSKSGEAVRFDIPLSGIHNIRNYAGAVILLAESGFDLTALAKAAAQPLFIPGRLEKYDLRSGQVAFVDYAHTPDALENVLGLLSEMKKGGRIFTVFGAGGNRDREKRPEMGKVAVKFSDHVIVTSDNPRNEDPQEIISQILAGMGGFTEVTVEVDRGRAIAQAVALSGVGDIILVAGKGHETTQETAGVKYPFSDVAEIKKYI